MSEEVKQLTAEDLTAQLKPLSENAFLRFFQKIWRWWLGVWYGFCDKHPKLSSIVYMAFFFIVFSEGVTILQFIIMTFLPFAFESIWNQPFVWPAVALGGLKDGAGSQLFYAIFNEPVKFILAGAGENGKDLVLLASTQQDVARIIAEHGEAAVLQASGLGNFIAFEIAVFIAQCVNFPLQRNITYRSHGNPYWQAMWYFIGWLGISIFVNALWGICNPLMMSWNWNEVVIGLIKTVITGGLSMVIFFPIFMIIFPDNNKMAKKARANYEKLVAEGAPAEKIEKAKAKMEMWEDKALKSNTEKDYFKAKSQVNAKVMSYLAVVKNGEKANEQVEKLTAANAPAEKLEKAKAEKEAFPEKIEKYFNAACEAVLTKDEKEKAFQEICGTKAAA